MKREACMLKIMPGMTSAIESAIALSQSALEKRCASVEAKNASAWSVAGYLYLYAEFEDGANAGLKDVIAPWESELLTAASYVARPGEMKLMYHDIGVVREDKSLIRRRVFATHLKPGCAAEYKARHQKLIDARGDKVSDGPETNFTIWCAKDEFIFGYCELVKSYDHEMTEAERESTVKWETRQLEIMDWFTDDVDWITGEKHEKMQKLFVQAAFQG